MNFLTNLEENIEGKTFLIRLDLNVPILEFGKIENFSRIEKSLESLNFLQGKKAKIIIISHIGKNGEQNFSEVSKYFQEKFQDKFFFDEKTFDDFSEKKIGELKEKIFKKNGGDILLLDNLRASELELKNDSVFAEKISSLADFYVNDAFSVSHRIHSSVSSLPIFFQKEKSYAGILFKKEYKNLKKALEEENKKILILGGSKIKTKFPLLKKAVENFDYIFLGGAILNDYLKSQNFEVGKSRCSENNFSTDFLKKSGKIILPEKLIVEDGDGEKKVRKINEVLPDDKIFDNDFGKKGKDFSKFIFFWNGPLGVYEKGYSEGSLNLFKNLEEKNKIILGGGNSVSMFEKFELLDKFDFVSTAGGAMLYFLEKKTLPGIEALEY